MKPRACKQLTFFPEASHSHASRFPSPGSDAAREMTVTSGMRCCGLLTKSGPLGSLAKMLLASSAWHSPLVRLAWKADRLPATRTRITTRRYFHNKRRCCSSVSSKTSVRSATMSRHLLFRLVPSAQGTAGTASRLWATPNAADCKGTTGGGQGRSLRTDTKMFPTPIASEATHGGPNGRGSKGDLRLTSAAILFPTPRAHEAGDYQYSRGDHARPVPTLTGAARMWPTPTRTDAEFSMTAQTGGRPIEKSTKLQTQVSIEEGMLPTPRAQSANSTSPSRIGHRADLQTVVGARTGADQLNPAWVTRLMGFPDGWLDR